MWSTYAHCRACGRAHHGEFRQIDLELCEDCRDWATRDLAPDDAQDVWGMHLECAGCDNEALPLWMHRVRWLDNEATLCPTCAGDLRGKPLLYNRIPPAHLMTPRGRLAHHAWTVAPRQTRGLPPRPLEWARMVDVPDLFELARDVGMAASVSRFDAESALDEAYLLRDHAACATLRNAYLRPHGVLPLATLVVLRIRLLYLT